MIASLLAYFTTDLINHLHTFVLNMQDDLGLPRQIFLILPLPVI